MNSKEPILTMMVALNCEAKPWVDFYKLKKVEDKPFVRFAKDGVNVEIIVTGIGSMAMSTAIGWAAGRADVNPRAPFNRVWLNIGIAGHLDRDIGEIVRVHSFIDAIDLKRHYLPQTAKWSGPSDALLSVNAPTNSYPDDAMVDMEGLAFYKSASVFSESEVLASIKVISDNQDNGVEALNAARISGLMQLHVAAINKFSAGLIALAQKVAVVPVDLDVSTLRMTHSQRNQLEKLLHKAAVLGLHDSVSGLRLTKIEKASDVLKTLDSLVNTTAPSLMGASNG